jgi:hypothetical protein
MNTEELRKKLLAAARANPPSNHVPLAFEKRVIANLAAKPAADIVALWARALWRAAVPCVAVTVLLGAFSFMPTSTTTTNATNEEDLSQTFEQTLLASSDQQEELW